MSIRKYCVVVMVFRRSWHETEVLTFVLVKLPKINKLHGGKQMKKQLPDLKQNQQKLWNGRM